LHVLIIPSERFVPAEEPMAGIFQRDQARALKKAGLKVGILAPTPRSLRWLMVRSRGWARGFEIKVDDGISVYCYQSWRWIPGRVPYLSIIQPIIIGKRLFIRYISDHGMPDLIHAHNSLYAGLIAVQLNKKYGIPFVLTEHSSAYLSNRIHKWQRSFIKTVIKNAAARIAVSRHLGKTLENIFPDVAASWEHIPNILDNLFEKHNYFKNGRSSDFNSFRFLTVGALTPIKGHMILLQAFAKAFKGNLAIQLYIVGDGPLHDDLVNLSKRLGIQRQVKFLGYLTREQVLREMQECDAFILPSLHETFGVVIIEALACGKPVIATSCGGPEEIINNKNGILVPPGDVISLGDAMLNMIQEVNKYDAFQIREDCISLFGEASVVRHLISVYERVLNGRG